jgi:hypothetical protein
MPSDGRPKLGRVRQSGSSGSPAQDLVKGIGAMAERERERRVHTALLSRAENTFDGLESALTELLTAMQGPWRLVGAPGEPHA